MNIGPNLGVNTNHNFLINKKYSADPTDNAITK